MLSWVPAAAALGALGATIIPQPLNEGEDERARQKRFHQGSAGPPMPVGVFPEKVPAKPGSLSDKSAIWMGSSPAQAVDSAMSKIGETINDADIQTYLRTGGHPDPGKAAWCAMFVGASLTKAGIKDSGGDTATSYETWGSPVPHRGVQKGDVYVRTKGLAPGVAGGHVGMLTGQTRFVHGREQVEMISGNSAHMVRKTWEPVGGTNMIRRAAGWPDHTERGSARKRFLPHREHVSALGHHPAHIARASEEVVIENLAGTFVSVDQG